jgi:nitrate reductase alpha subunit
LGFRWQQQPGQWNLELKDGKDGTEIDPLLTLIDSRDGEVAVRFTDFGNSRSFHRGVPVKYLDTVDGRIPVTTVYDLLLAEFGVPRALPGEYPPDYNDAESPYTPAWQEQFTGIGRSTVVQFAQEFATTAEKTGGKCMVIIGSGVNHWYHSNLHYRAAIVSLILCGCVGVNGGGLNHYTGQEKIVPAASWSTLAMALDWSGPPRLQNGPSFHYVHSDQWRYERGMIESHPTAGPFSRNHTMSMEADAVRMGWLPFYPQFNANPIELVRRAEHEGAQTDRDVVQWVVDHLRNRRVQFAVEDPDAPENWPRVWIIWRANAIHSSAKGQEFFFKHYLGTHDAAIADELAQGAADDVVWHEHAPQGKMDLVVDLNFRMDTSALYSDIVLPAASWYEKNDLNTTDLHSFIHPLGQAVPPCWESKTDWDIFKSLAAKVSELSRAHFPTPFREIVATPLLHDTPDELAQSTVQRWFEGECKPIPGKTMPRMTVVERDYANLYNKFCSLGPRLREHGVEDRAIDIPVADLYDEFGRMTPSYEWGGRSYPSLVDPVDAANMVLHFAPETNGEVAYRGFQVRERQTGQKLTDLAEETRAVRHTFHSITRQPGRILTSPCWSGIVNKGRAYSAYCQNTERLIPWRTLTGRQHFYLDHEGYLAFGENLPTFKPRISLEDSLSLAKSRSNGPSLVLSCLTPHGKWHIHSTYGDNLPMLTLSRGIEPFWINDKDAEQIGIFDNDWVEAYNDNGTIVTRVVVSARIPRGLGFFYHAPERTIAFPKSQERKNRRGGGTNSVTRLRLKPVLMVGGYGQHCYRFNDYGPPATDRDTYVILQKLKRKPEFY